MSMREQTEIDLGVHEKCPSTKLCPRKTQDNFLVALPGIIDPGGVFTEHQM